jgi:hypothetical protein
MGILRRRTIAGDLQSAPSMTLYKGGKVSTEEDGELAGRIPWLDREGAVMNLRF